MDTSYEESRWTIPLTKRPLVKEALKSDVDQTEARREQRRLVREICSLPEVRALPPEQFIVAFKSAVNDAASELGIDDGREREQLLSRLVSISIEEFFHPDGDGRGDSRFARARTWSERLHLSAIAHHLNGNSSQSKGDGSPEQSRDQDCRGIK
jgi:hypothetical protein